MFKMSARELKILKNTIVTTSDLLNNDDVVVFNNYGYTNCYFYALGIMERSLLKGRTKTWGYYQEPGFTYKRNTSYKFWLDNIMSMVEIDLENLGMEYRRIDGDFDNVLYPDEYLIKVFLKADSIVGYDFHFVRYDPKSGIWFHKMGSKHPYKFEENDMGVVKNARCENEPFVCFNNCGSKYISIGYFAVKELNMNNTRRKKVKSLFLCDN